MVYFEHNGKKLYYEITGEGHPLVLIHSALTHSGLYEAQVANLARHFRVLRYDLYGYGQSLFTDEKHINHGADLKALLQNLGIDQACVLGTSMGGEIALNFALEYPELVDGLILVGAGLEGYDYPEEAFAWWGDFVGAMQADDLPRAKTIFIQHALDSTMTPLSSAVRDTILKLMQGYTFRHYLDGSLLWYAPAFNPRAQLASIACPTLVMIGEGDSAVNRAIATVLASEIPTAKKMIIPGAAHLVNLQQSAAFEQAVIAFGQKLA
jgi:3-oxoadipate enol-lactonase